MTNRFSIYGIAMEFEKRRKEQASPEIVFLPCFTLQQLFGKQAHVA